MKTQTKTRKKEDIKTQKKFEADSVLGRASSLSLSWIMPMA